MWRRAALVHHHLPISVCRFYFKIELNVSFAAVRASSQLLTSGLVCVLGKEVTLCGEGMINGAGDIQMQIKCVKRTKLGLNLKPVKRKNPKQNIFKKLQKIAQHIFRLQSVLAVQLINYSWLNHLQLYVNKVLTQV